MWVAGRNSDMRPYNWLRIVSCMVFYILANVAALIWGGGQHKIYCWETYLFSATWLMIEVLNSENNWQL